MSAIQKSIDLLRLFTELRQILVQENENNWIRGVNLIVEALTPPAYGGKGNPDEAVMYVKNTYRKMVSGNGSFSDFFIWRDDFEDRKNANKELDRVRAEIWVLVDH